MDRVSTRALHFSALLILAAPLVGCDESPPNKPAATTASAAARTSPGASAAPLKPKEPELLVDSQGPYLGGRRVDLAAADGKDKLAQLVKDLNLEGKPVSLTADKRAKTQHV